MNTLLEMNNCTGYETPAYSAMLHSNLKDFSYEMLESHAEISRLYLRTYL